MNWGFLVLGRVVDGREIMIQFSKYGPNAERISSHKGKISESSSKLKSRSRSRSPHPRYRDEYKDMDYKRRSRSRSRDRYDRDRHHRSERKHRYRSRSRNNRKRSKYDDELRNRSWSYGRYRILPLPKVVGAGPIVGVSQEREVQCEAQQKCGCYGGFDLPIERWSCCPNSAHSCAYTVVKRKRGTLLRDLTQPGDEILVARGGQGGISLVEMPERSKKKLMALTTNVMRDDSDKALDYKL